MEFSSGLGGAGCVYPDFVGAARRCVFIMFLSRSPADSKINTPGCRTTLECTYRTVGKVRRPFTPIRTLLSIRTLFAQSSHRSHSHSHTIRTLFARSHTIRTLFARSHTVRTLFARSHVIRTVAHYSHTFRTVAHYSRGSHTTRAINHTKFADYSHQFAPRSHYSRGWGGPVRTHSRSIRTVHTRSHL